jgi:phage/plasmid-like protein (TIGR03299 family)
MAHELEHAHSMIYTGKTPWHGLGIALTQAPESVAEAIRFAGLGWTVEKQPLFLADGTQVDRWAVRRTSDNAVLGTVGPDYTCIQNADAFSPLQPFLEAHEATIETAGSLKGGARVWMLAKINRPDMQIAPGDDVAKYLLATTGHDGLSSFRLQITPIRVVCMNTLSAAVEGRSDTIRISHFKDSTRAIRDLAATMARIDGQLEDAAKLFRALATVKIRSAADLNRYVDLVFPAPAPKPDATPAPIVTGSDLLAGLLGKPRSASTLPSPFSPDGGSATVETTRRIHEEIARLFEFGRGNRNPAIAGTAWAAYNAVTEWNSHERGRDADTRLGNLWFTQAGPVSKALPAAVDTFLKQAA